MRKIRLAYVTTATVSFLLGALAVFYVWQFVGGGVWRGAVSISTIQVASPPEQISPTKLELTVPSCNGNPQVYTVAETEYSIRLRVVASSTPLKGRKDCQDIAVYHLIHRVQQVIDDHTGRVIDIGSTRYE